LSRTVSKFHDKLSDGTPLHDENPQALISGACPLLLGPVFQRELVLAPRRPKLFLARTVYVIVLLILMCTAWLVVAGTQIIRNVGDMSRFGAVLFQILAPLQLAVAIFGSAMIAASAVAQEKDRRTLILLLMTRMISTLRPYAHVQTSRHKMGLSHTCRVRADEVRTRAST
jgi:ABC-type transport system involved in cytochrome c biogenesis permease component